MRASLSYLRILLIAVIAVAWLFLLNLFVVNRQSLSFRFRSCLVLIIETEAPALSSDSDTEYTHLFPVKELQNRRIHGQRRRASVRRK